MSRKRPASLARRRRAFSICPQTSGMILTTGRSGDNISRKQGEVNSRRASPNLRKMIRCPGHTILMDFSNVLP
ncbi:hypothetical protein BDZ89DRAFT_83418 [Hymenopellis radicata]|nr:hypothetical protein BDZ89DRAFT_83418 [Hymenopellis radicata]